MNIKAKNNIPKLRFSEFGGEWAEKPFDKFYEFKSTNSYSRDQLNYESGEVYNIHYGDIHTKFKSRFDIQSENVPFINKTINLDRITEDKFCKEGDLVIADASEDYDDIGKTIELINLNGNRVLAGLHTLLAKRINDDICIGFSTYLMVNEKVRKQIKLIAQGTKVLGISAIRVNKIKLKVPKLEEQQKIASFLSSVDERLSQLGKKKKLLEQYKKGMMQKLFTQQISFKDGNGNDYQDWEEKRLEDILFEHKTTNHTNNISEVFSVSKHKGVINQIEHLGRSYAADSISHYKVANPFDVIYTKSPTSEFPFGIIKQNLTERSGVVSPLYAVFRPLNQHVGYILHTHFLSWVNTYNYLNPLVQKGAKNTMSIRNDDFLNGAKINFPNSTEEQTKIANFLASLDNKINLVTAELIQAQTFKKGLLQQMFI
jgi:type I restriction enzyme, S subunit